MQPFVRQLFTTQPVPFVRMKMDPGTEAQWILARSLGAGGGQPEAAASFRIVLSHSRKGYSEVVWRQTTESFIRCLENAFRYFGGVPRR